MKFANATKFERKSWGSGTEGTAVCVDGETVPGGDSPRRKVKLQVPPLRFASVGMTN